VKRTKKRGIFKFKCQGNCGARSLPHVCTHHAAARWPRRLFTRIK